MTLRRLAMGESYTRDERAKGGRGLTAARTAPKTAGGRPSALVCMPRTKAAMEDANTTLPAPGAD